MIFLFKKRGRIVSRPVHSKSKVRNGASPSLVATVGSDRCHIYILQFSNQRQLLKSLFYFFSSFQ